MTGKTADGVPGPPAPRGGYARGVLAGKALILNTLWSRRDTLRARLPAAAGPRRRRDVVTGVGR